jgi:hypothetical protein
MRKIDLYWDMYMSFEALEEHISDSTYNDYNGYIEYLNVDMCSGEYASVSEYTEYGAPSWATGVIWHHSV